MKACKEELKGQGWLGTEEREEGCEVAEVMVVVREWIGDLFL